MFWTRIRRNPSRRVHAAVLTALVVLPPVASAQTAETPPDRARDRGPGVATSMFGTYVRPDELLIYPFWEYYVETAFEFTPQEFGRPGANDLLGRYRESERLLFVGYGLSENVAIEGEAAYARASLTPPSTDVSGLPARIQESGLGDVEGQIRWRMRRETAHGPELFSYAEAVLPHHRDKPLIGTAATQIKAGTGLVRGFGWGTLTLRAAMEYDRASSSPFDVGEYAVEWLRRFSPRWRVYVGMEGTAREASLITDLQWHVSERAFVRVNNGIGLTRGAADWAPEIGVVFSIPTRKP